jgi:hypothetical protein
MYNDLSTIREMGVSGFKSVEQLWNDYSAIPNEKGIYFILNPDCSHKKFLKMGVGGFFKKEDPNVTIERLTSKWIDGCHLLYIGQAGGNGSSSTLSKRIKLYMDFGKGKPVGHKGGRFIWQLSHYRTLMVAWKATASTDPREEEQKLLQEFFGYYGKLPFANLVF